MPVIALLIIFSLAIAIFFLAGFIWAVRSGQFEDTYTPSLRVLTDEHPVETSRESPEPGGKIKP